MEIFALLERAGGVEIPGGSFYPSRNAARIAVAGWAVKHTKLGHRVEVSISGDSAYWQNPARTLDHGAIKIVELEEGH